MQRDFSPLNQRNVYDPWGRSGAGAPIKNSDGQIQTRTAGRVTHDSSVRMSRCETREHVLLLLLLFLISLLFV